MAETTKLTPAKNTGFSTPEKKSIIPATLPAPTKVYTTNIGRGRAPTLRWEVPEWDLVETGRILDTESIVRRAFRVKKNLFLKEGYEFTGSNLDRVAYVKKRLQQIEVASGIPFPILISQTISSLIRCANAFWVKVRKTEASGGKVRTVGNKKLKPVAGYFLLPAETVRFKRDEYGKIVKYQQEIYGKVAKEFRPEDVIHFYLDKREGYSVGTPILTPVKDDIRALRRIEENLELLVYQHLFPLFHYQVGTEDAPAAIFPDGTSEIDVVQTKVAEMPSDGCWVTPERHKITPLQAGSSPVAVDKVIDHFKQRIYTGIGVSSVDMGEGGTANRSTAQTMSRNLVDDTKADQKEFGAQFYSKVIVELLKESTFSQATLLDEPNRVYLKFKEIDFEARQAKENHLVDIFIKNAITHSEMRQMMGLEPFAGDGWPTGTKKSQMFSKGDGDWSQTNYGLIERDKVILQSLDEPGTDASKAEAASRTKATSAKAAGGSSVNNKNQPSNQHGTRSSTKINKDNLESLIGYSTPIHDIFNKLRESIASDIRSSGTKLKVIDFNLDVAFSDAKKTLVRKSKLAYRAGLRESGADIFSVNYNSAYTKIQKHIEKYILKLKEDLYNQIKRHTIRDMRLKQEDAVFVEMIFDALRHRTDMIDKSEPMRAYNFGLASGFRSLGNMNMRSVPTSDSACNICKEQFLIYKESDAIIYEELPPLHPHCKCKMKVTN